MIYLAKGGCAARRLSWVTPGFSQSRRCKTTASEFPGIHMTSTRLQKLVVTEKGKLLCQAVESQHLLTSAEMTAKWETYLKKIGKREGNQENFITNIKKFIVHLLEAVPNDIEKLNFSDYQEQKEKEAEKSIVGKCPKCGNNIVLKKSFYGCSNYPECTFTLAEHFRKKKLTKTNVKELLEGKETLVKGIKTKDRKSYNAVVKIGEKGYIDFISFSK